MAMDWAAMERELIKDVRTGDGTVKSGMFEGRQVLLLNTVGASSGQPRTTPLVYSVEDDTMVVIASAGGSTKHPAWHANLVKDPNVTVEAKGETFEATAVIVEDEAERQRLYDQHAELHPSFVEYPALADGRVIPVILLERLPSAA